MRKIRAYAFKAFWLLLKAIVIMLLIVCLPDFIIYLFRIGTVIGLFFKGVLYTFKGIYNGFVYAYNDLIPDLYNDIRYLFTISKDFWINSITNNDLSSTNSYNNIRQLVPIIKDLLTDLTHTSSNYTVSYIPVRQSELNAIGDSDAASTLNKIRISVYASIIIIIANCIFKYLKKCYFSKKYTRAFVRLSKNTNDNVFHDIDPADQVRAVFNSIKILENYIDSLKCYKFKIYIAINHVTVVVLFLVEFSFLAAIAINNSELPLCIFLYFAISALWAFEIYPSLSCVNKVDDDRFSDKQKHFFYISIFYYIFHIIKYGIHQKNNQLNSVVSDCKWLLLYSFPSNNQTIRCLKDRNDNIVNLNRILNKILYLSDNNIVEKSHIVHILNHIENIISVINQWPDSCSVYSSLNMHEINQVSVESQLETQEES